MVRRWFYQAEAEYSDFLMALLQSDVDAMNEYMNRISMEMFSCFGRYDIIMEPKKGELPAIIIEFKAFNKRRDKDLEETVASALTQIEEKQYEKELVARGL